MNSLWLVITALAAFSVAYRFYGAFLATKVAVLNDAGTSRRPTACATTSITTPRGGWCCSAYISPPSPGRGRWSGRCWRRSGATFPASPGS